MTSTSSGTILRAAPRASPPAPGTGCSPPGALSISGDGAEPLARGCSRSRDGTGPEGLIPWGWTAGQTAHSQTARGASGSDPSPSVTPGRCSVLLPILTGDVPRGWVAASGSCSGADGSTGVSPEGKDRLLTDTGTAALGPGHLPASLSCRIYPKGCGWSEGSGGHRSPLHPAGLSVWHRVRGDQSPAQGQLWGPIAPGLGFTSHCPSGGL